MAVVNQLIFNYRRRGKQRPFFPRCLHFLIVSILCKFAVVVGSVSKCCVTAAILCKFYANEMLFDDSAADSLQP